MINSSDILHGKILIVDDTKADVLLLEQLLTSAGYDCVTSTMDSGAVVELHRKNHYDLILLDIQMPGVDGFEVMAALKAIEGGGDLPVIVITAQSGHMMRALEAGARSFIGKPFQIEEVLFRVCNMVETRLTQIEAKKA